MTTIPDYLLNRQWLLSMGLLLLCTVFIWLVLSRIKHHLLPRLEKTSRAWDSTLLDAFYLPAQNTLLFLFIVIACQVTIGRLDDWQMVSAGLVLFKKIGVVLALFWFLMRYIARVETYMLTVRIDVSRKRDRTSVRAVSQLLRVVVVVVFFLIFMQIFGLPITSLLAFGGFGALALSFAAKDTLANFFGGMMIFWDKPFSVGDWVRSPDRDIEGTIDHIGWRLTRIITFDRRPLYVPNSLFSTILLENPSRMTHRRINATVGLRYDDANKVAGILESIEAMLRDHADIDATQTLMVNLHEFGASSLNFFIYTFTKTTDWVTFQRVQQDVFLKVIAIITEHGAECAFPTTTLHVPEPISMTN